MSSSNVDLPSDIQYKLAFDDSWKHINSAFLATCKDVLSAFLMSDRPKTLLLRYEASDPSR